MEWDWVKDPLRVFGKVLMSVGIAGAGIVALCLIALWLAIEVGGQSSLYPSLIQLSVLWTGIAILYFSLGWGITQSVTDF